MGFKLTVRPYIPRLKECNIRKGFFEPEQFTSVKNHLPVHLQPIAAFNAVQQARPAVSMRTVLYRAPMLPGDRANAQR